MYPTKLTGLWLASTCIVAAFGLCHGNSQQSPVDVVREFCELDGQGVRLQSETWNRVGRLLVRSDEAGTDSTVVISGFKISASRTEDKTALVEVSYDILGVIGGEEFIPPEAERELAHSIMKSEVSFELIETSGGWKILRPYTVPHVFGKVMAQRLRSVLTDARSNGRPRDSIERLEKTLAVLLDLIESEPE